MRNSVIALVAAAALAACGGENKEQTADPAAGDEAPATAKVAASDPGAAGPAAAEQPSSGTTGPGSWQRIGKDDLYKPMIAGAVHGGAFYHAVKDGTLYATDLASGKVSTVSRKPDFGAVRWLMDAGDHMLSLERNGTIYKITADASREPASKPGVYKDTIAAAVGGGTMFTIERDGTLYATDLATMKWKAIGKADFADTRMMLASADKLVTVEKDGSAFTVNRTTGKWANLGPNDLWKNTLAATFLGERLFRVGPNGALYEIEAGNGKNQPVGKPDFQHVRWIGATGDALITLEKDGSLYRVQP